MYQQKQQQRRRRQQQQQSGGHVNTHGIHSAAPQSVSYSIARETHVSSEWENYESSLANTKPVNVTHKRTIQFEINTQTSLEWWLEQLRRGKKWKVIRITQVNWVSVCEAQMIIHCRHCLCRCRRRHICVCKMRFQMTFSGAGLSNDHSSRAVWALAFDSSERATRLIKWS